MTQYKHTVLIAVPMVLVEGANHLACLLGENAADINTFSRAIYEDEGGNQYAAVYTVVKPVFLSPTATGALPVTPDHGIGIVDRGKAQRAFDSLNKPGGIQMLVDLPPSEALQQLGLTRIPSPEES